MNSERRALTTHHPSLKIGFDATAAVHQGAGIGRYARDLLAALAAREDDGLSFAVVYCGHGSRAGGLPQLPRRFRVKSFPVSDRIINALWHRARIPLPVQVATGKIDLFHSPDFTLPPTWGCPTVLTVHDLAFLRVPECAYPTLRAYLERVVPRSAKRATRIIAVSESTRHDVVELLGIPPDRVSVVYEGVNARFLRPADPERAGALVRAAGVSQPYILSVGTVEPRKNYVRLLEAYARLRERGVEHSLIIAGRLGWLYEPILARVDALGLQTHVAILQPDDNTLAALYALADACIFPSLYEGFGIPVLEALAIGAPVACSNASSFPEIVGGAAAMFDPCDVEAMANATERILSDGERRGELAALGPKRASQFSWDRAAEDTVHVYRQALADA